jgi:hypothetical protein
MIPTDAKRVRVLGLMASSSAAVLPVPLTLSPRRFIFDKILTFGMVGLTSGGHE